MFFWVIWMLLVATNFRTGGRWCVPRNTFRGGTGGFQIPAKNANEETSEPVVWRYQHFESYGAYQQKRSTMMATLRKVEKMASDGKQLLLSGSEKLLEFDRLGYPVGIRRFMCEVLYRDTGKVEWRYLRAEQAREKWKSCQERNKENTC